MPSNLPLYLVILVPIGILCLLEICFHHRSYELERQDHTPEEGRYTLTQFYDMMLGLKDLNTHDPHGYRATLSQFREWFAERKTEELKNVLEIGFGLGHFSIILGREYENATVIGIDAHELSVYSANQYLNSIENPPANVRFELRPEAKLTEMQKSFDVITTTLMNHHIFPDDQFVDFIQRVARVGKQVFIFNDLHRTLGCIWSNDLKLLLARYVGVKKLREILLNFLPSDATMMKDLANYENVFSNDRPGFDLIVDGGMLSMRRAFSISEYKKLFKLAGYPDQALSCKRLDKWYTPFSNTCRVVCEADLTWNN